MAAAADMTTGVILPPDWLITKKVAIPAEIAIIATFMKRGPGSKENCQIQLSIALIAKRQTVARNGDLNEWKGQRILISSSVDDQEWQYFEQTLEKG